jgi:hypothetical protein
MGLSFILVTNCFPAIVQQMESQNKPDKITASYIHHKTYNLHAGYHQQYANPGSKLCKMLGFIPRSKTDTAETRQNKASEVKLKTTRNVLVFGPLMQFIHRKETSLYKCIIKPIWTCGIQLWGCTKPSNTKIIQRLKSKSCPQ